MPEKPMPSATTRRVVLRYVAFQLPGLAAITLGASAAVEWMELPLNVALTAVGCWVLKDAVMFRFVRKAYEPGDGRTPRDVRDALGTATEEIESEGYVRIGSELWRARLAEGCESIAKGEAVRVVDVRGLTVVVDKEAGA
ncbi:MAG: NfeD family protein [Deltaproteobacteria bacterium]|nr:NfeD family protein [Deltaproteobacteria bacterium]